MDYEMNCLHMTNRNRELLDENLFYLSSIFSWLGIYDMLASV